MEEHDKDCANIESLDQFQASIGLYPKLQWPKLFPGVCERIRKEHLALGNVAEQVGDVSVQTCELHVGGGFSCAVCLINSADLL